ncbi:MAG: hypothetical protein EPN99_00610 [Frankiales bacterium]|nr:MAG: hypothetical protein EPN99_00610 [Frankiales bacterium]
MGSPRIDAIAALASTTGGIVTTAEVVAAGLDPRVAERQVRAGSWQRPARGVYVTRAADLSGLELGRVARRFAGERVVVSGLVALRELELRWLPASDDVLCLVAPEVRTVSSRRVVLRRTKELAQLQTWWRGGVELAPVQRAVVDAARETPGLRDVRGIVLGAVADNWADVDSLDAVLATTQRNGSGLARRAIEDARRGAASPPEAELVDELLGCGVPFYVNPQLWLDGRLLGCTDVYLPGLGIGGEVESVERHGSDDDTETTYDRHERVTAPGLELVHLSVRRIRRDVTEAAAHLLSRARMRRGMRQPESPGLVVVPRGPLLR